MSRQHKASCPMSEEFRGTVSVPPECNCSHPTPQLPPEVEKIFAEWKVEPGAVDFLAVQDLLERVSAQHASELSTALSERDEEWREKIKEAWYRYGAKQIELYNGKLPITFFEQDRDRRDVSAYRAGLQDLCGVLLHKTGVEKFSKSASLLEPKGPKEKGDTCPFCADHTLTFWEYCGINPMENSETARTKWREHQQHNIFRAKGPKEINK